MANARAFGFQLAVACCCCMVAAACAVGSGATEGSRAAPKRPWEELEGAHFRWVSAQCVDGPLDLARQGFERTLLAERDSERPGVALPALSFTYETQLAQPQCVSTEVWSISKDADGADGADGIGGADATQWQWNFVLDTAVALPPGAPCGPGLPQGNERGTLNLNGDTLEEVRFGSAFCRGFDVRFVYRRIPARPPTQAELIRLYVAHWNRRDAAAVAALFAQHGTLSEPFSRSTDGLPTRHEGRAQIERWLSDAFVSVPWFALQLSAIETLDEQGQSLALWRYFDPKLAEPLQGRNLFVLAGGEIFASELQLVSEPVAATVGGVARPPN